MKTRLAYATTLGAVALLACVGCSSNNAVPADAGTAVADSSVGASDGSVADGSASTFATSACGTCVSTACAAAITACNGEPECANYWACVGACGVGPNGSADPTCSAGCALPTGSAAVIDQQQLAECQSVGPGASCTSCGSGSGAGDGGEEGGILGQSCPNGAGTDTAPCPVCEDDYCCNTYAACHADPECVAFATCDKDCVLASEDAGTFDAGLADAGGLTCAEICYALHPAGLVHFAPRLACLNIYCSTATTCDEGVAPAELTCVACQVAHCSHEMAALYGTPDGFLLQDCFNTCGDMAGTPCEQQCVTKYPNVSAAWNAFETCATKNCVGACG